VDVLQPVTGDMLVVDILKPLVTHGNHRVTGMFHPNEGRFAASTDENLQKLREGKLEVSIDFFDLGSDNCDPTMEEVDSVHPFTKSSHVYCAVDKFHLKNISTEADKLRNVKLVKQLRSQINTQVQEQFFSVLKRDIYYLNSLSPIKFMFLLRLIIHFRNSELRLKQLRSVESLLSRSGITVAVDDSGRLNKDANINAAQTDAMGEDTEDVPVEIASDCIPLDVTCSEDMPTAECGTQSGVMSVDSVDQSIACDDEVHYNLRKLPTKVLSASAALLSDIIYLLTYLLILLRLMLLIRFS